MILINKKKIEEQKNTDQQMPNEEEDNLNIDDMVDYLSDLEENDKQAEEIKEVDWKMCFPWEDQIQKIHREIYAFIFYIIIK